MTTTCLDENQAVDFVEGRTSGRQRELAIAHLAACPPCRAVVAELARSRSPALDDTTAAAAQTPGVASIGRFVIRGVLGRGGMGLVYEAHDPELGRPVAVKVLRSRGGHGLDDGPRARLVREARALARLSHPHIVGVYDAGISGDDVYIALELVRGATLRAWLAERPRSRDEILDHLAEVGDALAAAHDAGLVHRDVKPDNILIGNDGRARLADFGLVTAAGDGAGGEPTLPPAEDLERSLTATGTILGTPAFMAPEQHAAAAVDARTDQFSFCVTACDVLAGRRPISGRTPEEIAASARGALRVPDGIPRRIAAVLARGLATRPDDRYPDMRALLADLARARRPPRWRRLAAAGAAASAIAATAVAGGLRGPDPPALCDVRTAREAIARDWHDDARDGIRRAFARSAGGAAAASAPEDAARVIQILDAYADEWAVMRTDACRATRVSGHQPERILELRSACLVRRQFELSALVRQLARADAVAVRHAAEAADALISLSVCADVEALSAVVPAPEQPAIRAEVDAVTDALADARTLERLGNHTDSERLLVELERRAGATGHAPVVAEVLYELGWLLSRQQQWQRARPVLEQAERAADAGRHDRVRFLAAAELGRTIGYGQGDVAGGRAAIDRARAVLTRLGGDPTLESDLVTYTGQISLAAQEYDQAVALMEQALALRRQGGQAAKIASAHHNLALALHWKGDLTGALDHFRRAADGFRAVYGRWHLDTASAILNAGNVLLDLDRSSEALQHYREALASRLRSLGSTGPLVGDAHMNVAAALDTRQEFQAAREHYRAALAAYGDGRPREAARVYRNMGVSFAAEGRLADARAALATSLSLEPEPNPNGQQIALYTLGEIALQERSFDEARARFQEGAAVLAKIAPDHDDLPDFWDGEGKALRGAGQPGRALALHERALAARERALGADGPALIGSLVAIAEAQLARSRPAEALAAGERARALLTAGEAPDVRGHVLFAVARALWQARRDPDSRKRARALAAEAEQAMARAGPGATSELAAIRRWLQAPG